MCTHTHTQYNEHTHTHTLPPSHNVLPPLTEDPAEAAVGPGGVPHAAGHCAARGAHGPGPDEELSHRGAALAAERPLLPLAVPHGGPRSGARHPGIHSHTHTGTHSHTHTHTHTHTLSHTHSHTHTHTHTHTDSAAV